MSSKDTWRELAEMLGLPPDEPPPQTVKPAEASASRPAKTDTDEPELDERPESDESGGRALEDRFDDEPIESSLAEHGPIERDDDDDEFFVPPLPSDSSDDIEVAYDAMTVETIDEAGDEGEGDAGEEAAGTKPADDRPREGRRRRRGRRGRRRGGEEGGEPTAPDSLEGADGTASAPVTEGESAEGDDESRGRRRRRRRDGEGEEFATAVEEGAEGAEDAPDSDEGDDFSKDAWADWNVPNWQELIDGLYRPDRDR